jgi:hypothetical protein
MAIIMFGMLTILIVDIFLVRLLSKLINSACRPAPSLKSHRPCTAAMPAQFQNPNRPLPSVTKTSCGIAPEERNQSE